MELPAEPPPPHAPAIRVSDQDREGVVQRLQAAFAEGRLDDEEFDERTRAALTARTSANLAPLLDDLPAAARPAAAPVPGRETGAVRPRVQELDQAGRPLAGPRAVHLGCLQGRRLA